MSKVHMLRALVEQRLTSAAEEIFELFERTMGEYEEELCRQGKLLNAVFQPEVRLHRADVQQLMVNREAVPPEQQIWSPSLEQQNPPELPNIKEEQEELWTKQEEEQLQLLEEADITKFTMTDDCKESGGPHSGLNFLHNNGVLLSDKEINTGEASVSSSERAANFEHKGRPQKQEHNEAQTGVRSFSCSVCSKTFLWRQNLKAHMRIHTGEKPFICSVCGKEFAQTSTLTSHLRVHTGEKPFSCSICKACFSISSNLDKHIRIHSGEKPFSCSICGKTFGDNVQLRRHAMTHTGEKPFSCSVCGKRFAQQGHLRTHSNVHTGEKPFSCSVCGKRFAQHGSLRRHSNVHTGDKPFHCSICDKRFARRYMFKKHKCVGDNSRNK